MRLTISLMALALAFGSTACKKGGAGDAIKKMGEFKDQMCACKDKACVDKVNADMNKWGSEQKGGEGDTKVSEDDAKKMAAISEEMSKCMTKVMTDMAGSGSAGSGSSSDMGGSGSAGSGSAAMAGSGSAGSDMAGSDAAAMLHHAGMCPSTVLGSTTTAAVKGKDVIVTIKSKDKDAIATIQKRTDELLTEKKDAKPGTTHDQKGTFGGSKGICPVHVPEGGKASFKKAADGVVVTITPKDKPDELKTDVDARIAKAAAWVKTNIKEGDKGNQGGVGGGKGPEKSNHSGQGDSKGKERKNGSGGGAGTGGGGGKGTGGGGGSGSAGKG